MREHSREQGFTLIELQVTFILAGLVSLVLLSLFLTSLSLFRRGTESVDAGEATVAMSVITRDIRESSGDPDEVRLWPLRDGDERQDAIAVRSARMPDGSFATTSLGLPAWGGWVAFVYDPEGHEVRSTALTAVSAAPPAPDAGRIIARRVRSFAVDREGDHFVVTLQVEQKGGMLTLQTATRPRNW